MYSIQALSIDCKLIFPVNAFTRLARFIKMTEVFMIEQILIYKEFRITYKSILRYKDIFINSSHNNLMNVVNLLTDG